MAVGSIAEAERERRQAVVRYALSTVGLEGFVPDEATQAAARCWINGEIGMADLVAIIRGPS